MSNNIFTVEEIIQLFDDFILGNPDPNLNIVTQRIMEQTILKDKQHRLTIFQKIIQIFEKDEGNHLYFPLQDLFKRTENLIFLILQDPDPSEQALLKKYFNLVLQHLENALKLYQNHPETPLFQFIKNNLEEKGNFNFNCLTTKSCLACLRKKESSKTVKLNDTTSRVNNRDIINTYRTDNKIWIAFRQFQSISSLRFEIHEYVARYVTEFKLYRLRPLDNTPRYINQRNQPQNVELIVPAQINASEKSTVVVMNFQPSLLAETLCLQIMAPDQLFQKQQSREFAHQMSRELARDRFIKDIDYLSRSSQQKGEPSVNDICQEIKLSRDTLVDYSNLTFNTELEVENLQKIINDMSIQSQTQLSKINEQKAQLNKIYEKLNYKFNALHDMNLKFKDNMLSEMVEAYEDYNSNSIEIQQLSQKCKEYFQQSQIIQSSQNLFTDCVTCNQHFIQNVLGFFQKIKKDVPLQLYNILWESLFKPLTRQEQSQFIEILSQNPYNIERIEERQLNCINDLKKVLESKNSSNQDCFNETAFILQIFAPSLFSSRQVFFKECMNLSTQISKFNKHCQNGLLSQILIIVNQNLKNIGKDNEENRKQGLKNFIQNILKIRRTQQVKKIIYNHKIEEEITLETQVQFAVTDNLISNIIPLKQSFSIHSPLKSIIDMISQFDFQLGVGVILKVLKSIYFLKQLTGNTYELFSQLPKGDSEQAVAELLSLVEIILDLNQGISEQVPLLKLLLEPLQQSDFQDQFVFHVRLEKIVKRLLAIDLNSEQVEVHNSIRELVGLCFSKKNSGVYTILLNQLLNSKRDEFFQRIVQMLHLKLFKRIDYRIIANPNKNSQDCDIKQTKTEIFASDLPHELGVGRTVESLKKKLKEDLKLDEGLDFDILVHSKLVDDTSRPLDPIYLKFYLMEQNNKSDPNYFHHATYRQIREQDHLLIRAFDTLQVEYSFRGIGNHEQLPYIPQITDEDQINNIEQLRLAMLNRVNSNETTIVHFFRILQNLTQDGRYKQTVRKLVEILKVISSDEEVQKEIYSCQGIIILVRIFLMESQTTKRPNDLFQDGLIQLIAQLLSSAEEMTIVGIRRRASEFLGHDDQSYFEKECLNNLKLVLTSIDQFNDKDFIQKVLLQVTPIIVKDNYEACRQMVEFFEESFGFRSQDRLRLDQFSQALFYTPVYYKELRQLAIQKGVFQNAYKHLDQIKQLQKFPDQAYGVTTELAKHSLRIVCSVAKAKQDIQIKLYNDGYIDMIFQLSTSPEQTLKQISKISDDFIRFLGNNYNVHQEVSNFIKGRQNEKQQSKQNLAKQKREEMLKKFQKKNQFQDLANQIETEKGLQCQTCWEGYTINQQGLLVVYLYTQQHLIPDEKSIMTPNLPVVEVLGTKSVTYFTVMHMQCHKKAYDQAMHQHRKERGETGVSRTSEEIEWECAQKNNVARCNNLFPIKPPNQTQSIDQGLQFFNNRADHLLHQKTPSLFWLILNDLKLLLIAFTKGEDLARLTGAGRYEHNIKLIPFQLSALIYIAEKNNDNIITLGFILNQFSKDLNDYDRAIHMLQLTLVASLLFINYNGWKNTKQKILMIIKQFLQRSFQIILKNIKDKECRYLYNWVALTELIFQRFLSKIETFAKEGLEYMKIIDKAIIQDNKKTTLEFLEIEKIYSQNVLKAANIEEFADLLK